MALLPLWRNVCWGFFHPKNPTSSARCEPADLGTKGQHAASRPPKPVFKISIHEPKRYNTNQAHNLIRVYSYEISSSHIADYNLLRRNIVKLCRHAPMLPPSSGQESVEIIYLEPGDSRFLWNNGNNLPKYVSLRPLQCKRIPWPITIPNVMHTILNLIPQPLEQFTYHIYNIVGLGSSVSIVTGYGLDSPGIESQRGRDFPHLSRTAPGPNQPPVQWVLSLSQGVKSGWGMMLTFHPLLVPWS
jgi:hypothetical protein